MSLQLRAISMIKASFLGDAASMSLHWIYDQSIIAAKLSDGNDALFFPTPSCPYYNYPLGVLSPYGDESRPLLQSVSTFGAFDFEHAANNMYNFFRSYPEENSKGYSGRLNHAPKEFVAARDAGKSWSECSVDDSQANGIAKVPIIVARYAGDSTLLDRIESMVRIIQNSDLSVSSAKLVGKILEKILLTGDSPANVLHSVASDSAFSSHEKRIVNFMLSKDTLLEWASFVTVLKSKKAPPSLEGHMLMRLQSRLLMQLLHSESLASAINTFEGNNEEKEFLKDTFEACVERNKETVVLANFNEVAGVIGLSCALPSALMNVLYIWAHADSFETALRMNVVAGGDNCSRALVLAAAYGAHNASAISRDLEEKVRTELWREISEAAEKIANDNQYLK